MLDAKDRAEKVFEHVKRQMCNVDGSVERKTTIWKFDGQDVCKTMWCYCHFVSRPTTGKFQRLVAAGHVTLPPRLPKVPPAKSSSQIFSADAWLLHCYQHLAEPLANIEVPEPDSEYVEVTATHPLWSLPQLLRTSGNHQFAAKRFLNPGDFEQLWQQYCFDPAVQPHNVSKSTFKKAWAKRWKQFLCFRHDFQQKRCKECARLDEERIQATTWEEKCRVAREKQAHIDCVMADRQVGVRGNHISEIDASRANGDGMGQMVKIAIDGMDQAKFKVPRNLKSSAEFSSLWRPALHVVGCLAFGHVEAYYIMNSDQKKMQTWRPLWSPRSLTLSMTSLWTVGM